MPETIDQTDDLIDEASIRDGRAIVRFTRTEAALAELRTKYRDAVYDLTTTAGDTAARQARKALVSLRTGLDKRRKELKLPALEFSRKIDSEAARITAEIEALEHPIDAQIKADEQRREDLRLAATRADEERQARHRQRIDAIRSVATRAVGMSSNMIAEKLALVTRLSIEQADYEEFFASAVNAKAETLLQLQDMHAQALKAEEAAAQAERDRQRLAEAEAELARQRQELADARAESARLAALAEGRQTVLVDKPADPSPEPGPHPFADDLPDPVEPATLNLGAIAKRLGFALPQTFIEGCLLIPHAAQDKRAVLWRESQWPQIRAALVKHIEALA